MAYRTGRERTLTWTADTGGEGKYVVSPSVLPPGLYYLSYAANPAFNASWYLPDEGTAAVFVDYQQLPSWVPPSGTAMGFSTVGTADVVSRYVTERLVITVGGTVHTWTKDTHLAIGTVTLTPGGSFSMTAPAEEWHAESADPSNNSNGFPTRAGAPYVFDFPYGRNAQTTERLKPGQAIEVIASIGGVAGTASATIGTVNTDLAQGGYALNCMTQMMGLGATTSAEMSNVKWCGIDASYSWGTAITACSVQTGAGATAYVNAGGTPAAQVLSRANLTLSLPIRATIGAAVYRMAEPHNATLTAVHHATSGDMDHEGTVNAGGWNTEVEQRYIDCSANLNGSAVTGPAHNEWTPVRMWIKGTALATEHDDTEHHRMLFRGRRYDALALSQSDVTVDPCSGTVCAGDYPAGWTGNRTVSVDGGIKLAAGSGPGTLTRSALGGTATGLSGHRYLRYSAAAGATGSVVVTIGAKQWAVDRNGAAMVPGGSLSTFEIDLCTPSNYAATVDTFTTEWPYPTADDSTGQGCRWGVQECDAIQFTGITDGYLTIGSIATFERTERSFDIMPAFNRWDLLHPPEAISETVTATTWVRRHICAHTDGRISLELHDGNWTQNVGGVTTNVYTEDTIADKYTEIPITGHGSAVVYMTGKRHPGWSAAYGSGVDTADGTAGASGLRYNWLNKNRPATWLWGGGLMWAGTGWSAGLARNCEDSLTIPAQELYDVVRLYPGAGDIFEIGTATGSASYSGTTPLRCGATIRGGAWGIVTTLAGPPSAHNIVTATGITYADNSTGDTDTEGHYETGATYMRCTQDYRIVPTTTESPVPTGTITPTARYRHRCCTRGAQSSGGWISYDVTPAQRHARAYMKDGSVIVQFAGDYMGAVWGPEIVAFAGDQPCCRWQSHARFSPLWVSYTAGGQVLAQRTEDEGQTWSASVDIAAGSYPAMCITRDGRQWHYWTHDGAILGCLIDPTGGTVIAASTVVASGVDADAIACDDYAVQGGVWRIGLLYRTGGDLVRVTSADGITFA